jgi:hypothetical protein
LIFKWLWVNFDKVLEAPNPLPTGRQANTKHQIITNDKQSKRVKIEEKRVGCLDIGDWGLFGICNLVIGISQGGSHRLVA